MGRRRPATYSHPPALVRQYIHASQFSECAFATVDPHNHIFSYLSADDLLWRIGYMLEHPFPSSPSRPPRVGFYVKSDAKSAHFNFYAMYAARAFLTQLLGDVPYKWLNDTTIRSDLGITIRGEGEYDLDKIIEYKPTAEESRWVLPEPYPSQIASLLDITPSRAPALRTGTLTPQDLARDLNLDAGKIRARLRKLNIAKPYSWNEQEYSQIIARVRARA
jgi:hypothetical protein